MGLKPVYELNSALGSRAFLPLLLLVDLPVGLVVGLLVLPMSSTIKELLSEGLEDDSVISTSSDSVVLALSRAFCSVVELGALEELEESAMTAGPLAVEFAVEDGRLRPM